MRAALRARARPLWASESFLFHPALCSFPLPTALGHRPSLFFGFSWMFSKCHGKCQQSLNQWPTDICPCLVPQPPVSLDLEGGADRPPPVSPSRLFSSSRFHAFSSRVRVFSKSFRCNNFKIHLFHFSFVFFFTVRWWLRPPLARFVD